jgi:hypothetical protein
VTPLQVAKAECANCDSAGNCAGVGIRDDGSLYLFRREAEKCWLAPGPDGAIARCQYFEECVAPLAKKRAQAASTQEQREAAARLAEGVRAYDAVVMPAQTIKYAKCKRCQQTVYPPKRLCARCAKNSTLKSKRQYWSKTRKNETSEAVIINDL